MATTINKTQALTALARMMGKRRLPNGDLSDWESYIQTAFDYAWRYYKWGWSMRSAVIDTVNDPYLPADFDLDGYIKPLANANGEVGYLNQEDFLLVGQSSNTFTIEYDATLNKYKVIPSPNLGTLTILYQVAPPTLGETDVPFPSAMTIGIGAAIWAKQADNPTRADVQQEWDEFHSELKRHVAHSEASKPRQVVMNLQDAYGTYTGYVGY